MSGVRISQFDVFQNPNVAQRDGFSYRVVMQSDQLDHFSTRFVMPLARLVDVPKVLPRRLSQAVRVAGESLRPTAHLRAPLPDHVLKEVTGTLKARADILRDALDAVVSGV